jgi:hypothetical protein
MTLPLSGAESSGDWKLLHHDPMTGDWQETWSQDSDSSEISSGEDGLTWTADKGNDVLWFTQGPFAGDIKITYEFEHLTDSPNVLILFVQANGVGGDYPNNVLDWQDQRPDASYGQYKGKMNYISVSYANGQDEVRFRHSIKDKGAERIGEFPDDGAFDVGVVYDVTFVREGRKITFEAKNRETGKVRTWTTELLEDYPLEPGWIGLRTMNTQAGRYKDFKVYSKETAE